MLIEAVENHMPQVIVIDEIGTKLEAAAASTIAQRGIQLVATAHGITIENLVMNPALEMLVGGVQVSSNVLVPPRIYRCLKCGLCEPTIFMKGIKFETDWWLIGIRVKPKVLCCIAGSKYPKNVKIYDFLKI